MLADKSTRVISNGEILDVAERTSLQPHIVEKDYVLGWVLAGIYAHSALKDRWVFKGGTSVDTSNPAIDRHRKTGHHAGELRLVSGTR